MNKGKIFAGAVLFYGALCLILAGLLLILGAVFVALNQGSSLGEALLLTGLIALAPVVTALFVLQLKPHPPVPAPPSHKSDAILGEIGALLGKEASDLVTARPWQTLLVAALAGFVASSNPKILSQIKKTLGL